MAAEKVLRMYPSSMKTKQIHLWIGTIMKKTNILFERCQGRVRQSKKRASNGHQKKVGGRCPQTRTFVSKPTLVHTLFRPTYTQKFVAEVGTQTLLKLTWVFPVYTDVGEVGFPLSVSGIDHWSVNGTSTAMTIQNTSVSVDFLTMFMENVFGSCISG